jgi:signal transduction histidine kinase
MWSPRLRALASAGAVAVLQVVGSIGAADNQPERRPFDAVALVLVLLGPAALALRDRWPLGAVVVSVVAAQLYIGAGYAYGPVFVSVAVAVFGAIQRGHRRATWALVAVSYAGFLVAASVDPRGDGVDLARAVVVAGWSVLLVVVSELVRVRREQLAERREAMAEAERRRAGEQRLRLARELHDVLAHNISLINVQASVALHLLDDRPEQARPALETIKSASADALAEIRTALDVLRGDAAVPVAPAPRLVDLPELIEGARLNGLDVHFASAGTDRPVPAAVELTAYRIVQEALTNVTRHARATCVDVRVRVADQVEVEVVDDGVGGAAEPGIGITGMTERAHAVGGTLLAGPRPGGGFEVRASLPCGAP